MTPVVPLQVASETLDRHKRWLLGLPGCTGVAVGEKHVGGRSAGPVPAIVLYVSRKRRRTDDAIPPVIDGVPTDVVAREFGFRPISTDPLQRYATMFCGVAITTWENPLVHGTLGCFIHTTGKIAGGGHPAIAAGVYMLTNHHVIQTADPNAGGDPRILQPNHPNYHLHVNPIPNNYRAGGYVDGYRSATNDCAIASIGYNRSWSNSIPAAPLWPGYRWLWGTAAAAVGANVYKFGATTRYTTARITNINFNTPTNSATGALYIENANHDTWVAGGDSGSVAVHPYSNSVVGLIFQEDALAVPTNSGVGCYGGLAYPIATQLANFRDAGGSVTLPWTG